MPVSPRLQVKTSCTSSGGYLPAMAATLWRRPLDRRIAQPSKPGNGVESPSHF
jgi:hypothetical protein